MPPKHFHCCSGHTPWQEGVSEGKALRRRSQSQGNLGERQIPYQSPWSHTSAGCCAGMFIDGCPKEMGPCVSDSGTSIRGDPGLWSMQQIVGGIRKEMINFAKLYVLFLISELC